ncbi:MAG: PilW family protein [Gammaproteobacteria bacterium]|nr:PilW family protein [Gammaproteobacteria bacterium]NND46521.1 pilus assembly protein PilW [Woeseiaceae bacterium]NNL44342.1 pilus assembly protein PilW [Woeseiaceae bacterium]
MTLVEVMIAMLLGVFLMGGVLQVFASSRQTYRVHEATSRMQENGRMALEVLSRDIRMADFWGCASDPGNFVNNLDETGTGYVDFLSGGIEGTDGASGAPDSLTLRGGIDSGITVQPPYGPQASANIKVPAGNGLEQDDIVFVADCSAGDIFQITNANPDTSGTVVHNTGSGDPGNFNVTNPGCPGANAHCLSKVYGSDASMMLTQEINYEIKAGSEGQPALFRNDLEFLDGIENLQILYGHDTDGSGTANYYAPADPLVDMADVISIRFAVVVRSYDDNLTGGLTQNYNLFGTTIAAPDNRLRQVYTSTVAVRNRL